jgi:hypothetical protein
VLSAFLHDFVGLPILKILAIFTIPFFQADGGRTGALLAKVGDDAETLVR